VSVIDRIRHKVRKRAYYLSSHAEEEMVADGFDWRDVESAILHGSVVKKLTDDPRGTRYIIEGPGMERRVMHVVCRFRETADLIIIIVYAIG